LIDVRDILKLSKFDAFLFGSRSQKTGSVRSDIDIALFLDRRISAEEARQIWDLEPYLDIFYGSGGTIQSIVNESSISQPSQDELITKLGAIPLFLEGNWQAAAEDFRVQSVLANRNPTATVVELYELGTSPPANRADILVVAALPKEYRAAAATLGAVPGWDSGVGRIEIDDRFGDRWLVEIVLVNGMGSVAAALVTQDGLRRTKAPHVVLLGIAAGVPGRIALGDVVIPEQICYYEPQKITDFGDQVGPSFRDADDRVRLAASVMPLLSGLDGKRESVAIHADVIIASGEKVVASEVFRDKICAAHRKIAAFDMEAYGVATAAVRRGARVTIIKSICDFADNSKNDDFQEFAAYASAVTFGWLVREGAFRWSSED